MQRVNGVVLPLFALALASASFAQLPMIGYSGGADYSGGAFHGNAKFRFPMPAIPMMANAPYSGREEVELSPTTQGGVTVRQPNRLGQKFWRDSQGRIRVEKSFDFGPNRTEGVPTIVQIQDPVAGFTYIMDDVNKVAHRIKVPVVPQPNLEQQVMREATAPLVPLPGSPQPPQRSLQDLGTQTMDGVLIHGTRVISVVPAGSRGSDRPITSTRDTWYSPDLNLIIRTVMDSPTSGTQTEKVANLSRSDPDPLLFLVPVDYRMVDESSGFEITWGNQGGQGGFGSGFGRRP